MASLVADESDEFSTDTEQRAYNIMLTTVYGPVGRKGGPPPVVDIAVSPGFMKELAAEKSVRDRLAEERLDPMRMLEEHAEDQRDIRPLGRSSYVPQMSDEMEASWRRAQDKRWGISR